MHERGVTAWAAWVICVAGVICGGWLALRYVLPLLLPFLLAWGSVLMIMPLAEKMRAHCRRSRRFCALILLLLMLLLLALLLILGVNRLIFELGRLFRWLGEDGGMYLSALLGRVTDWFDGVTTSLPLFDRLFGDGELEGIWSGIDEIAAGVIADAVSGLSTQIPAWIASVVRALPKIALFVAAWVIASFYFCLDLSRIHAAVRALLPPSWRRGAAVLRRRAAGTALKWLRAYLLLLLLTFGELLTGFLLLGLDYAFLSALVIALVDILPVFGVGTVLIPWAVVLLINGRYYLGFGLIIIYAVVAVVRQIAEPRIVGGSIGLHPLLTLVAMYIGFRVFGLAGMLLSPAVALAVGVFRADEEQAGAKSP